MSIELTKVKGSKVIGTQVYFFYEPYTHVIWLIDIYI